MSDPVPTLAEATPGPDLETVTLQGTYRIGYQPPVDGTLAAGEIYIQVPADGGAPAMFVGGLEGTVVSMVTGTLPARSAAKEDPPHTTAAYHRAPTPAPKEDPKDKK